MFIQHDRRSIRLPGHDYSHSGAYFVTICAFEGAHIFGRVGRGGVGSGRGAARCAPTFIPNQFGQIVIDEWVKTAAIRPYVRLDEFVVMPNHVHGILWIDDCGHVGAQRAAPLQHPHVQQRSLGAIIRGFKSAVTKRIHESRRILGPIWQRNYYERIIRDERELFAMRNYIRNNPANWERDEYR